MTWAECVTLIRSDVFRVTGSTSPRAVVSALLRQPSSRFLLTLRVGAWAQDGGIALLPVRLVNGTLHRRWTVRYGIEIPYRTTIGPGLKISHRVGGIVVNQHAVLGSNVTLTPGVVIGNNAGRPGAPVIGDGVVIQVGAKIIGGVSIGDGAQVGAGSVVTRNIPAGAVAAGVPARVLEGRTPIVAGNATDEG